MLNSNTFSAGITSQLTPLVGLQNEVPHFKYLQNEANLQHEVPQLDYLQHEANQLAKPQIDLTQLCFGVMLAMKWLIALQVVEQC